MGGKFDWQEDDMIGLTVVNPPDEEGDELSQEIARLDVLLAAAGVDENDPTWEDALPRTMYVKRPVKNAADIIRWAKSQGFKDILPADKLHVTIAWSDQSVDWMKMGEAWEEELVINAGGPRLLETLGTAQVLLFVSSSLTYRHESFADRGASWRHAEYQPHISITYTGEMPEGAKPYVGKIVLGPEEFKEVDDK